MRKMYCIRENFSEHGTWQYLIVGLLAFCGIARPLTSQAATSDWHSRNWSITTSPWNNLTGRLLFADGESITIHSPDFVDPLVIPLSQIRQASVAKAFRHSRKAHAAADATVSQDKFLFFTSSEAIRGELLKVDQATVRVRTKRHGEFSLFRSNLRAIRHLGRQPDLKNHGMSLAQSRPVRQHRSLMDWQEVEGQGLVTSVFGAELFRDYGLPETGEVRVIFESTTKLQFCLAIGHVKAHRLSKDALKVETWNDDLAALCEKKNGTSYHTLGRMPDIKHLELRLRWDELSQEFSVHSASGDLLGKLDGIEKGARTGVYIQNRGKDLKIVEVSVSSTNRFDAEDLGESRVRWEFLDGSFEIGTLEAFNDKTESYTARLANGEVRTIPCDKINEVVFHEKALPTPPTNEHSLVIFDDSTRLTGRLTTGPIPGIYLESPISPQKLFLPVNEIVQIERLQSPDSAAKSAYTLILDGRFFSGQLVSRDQSGQIGWQTDGTRTVTRPTAGKNACAHPREIGHPKAHGSADASHPSPGSQLNLIQDVVYLKSGELIPCEIVQSSATELEIASTEESTRKIPMEVIRGIEFQRGSVQALPSFLDWESSATDAQLERTSAGLKFYSRLQSPRQDGGREAVELVTSTTNHGDHWEFDVEFNHPTYLQIQVLPLDDERGPDQRLGCFFTLSFHGSLIQGLVYGFNAQQLLHRERGRLTVRDKTKAHVAIDFAADSVTMTIDDQSITEEVPRQVRSDQYQIRLTCQSMQNQIEGAPRNDDSETVISICSIRDFRVGSNPLQSRLRLSDEERDFVLTVPRGQRFETLQQLAIARNGDLLRGKLLSIGKELVHFQVGARELELPRERFTGIVWMEPPLAKPQERVTEDTRPGAQSESAGLNIAASSSERRLTKAKAVASQDADRIDLILENGLRLQLSSARLVDTTIEGVSKWTGKAHVPLSAVRQIRFDAADLAEDVAALPLLRLAAAKEPRLAIANSSDDNAPLVGTRSPLVGKPMGLLTCTTLGGSTFSTKDVRGKILVVDFWATWCAPCVRELPKTVATVAAFPAEQVQLLAINQGENVNAIKTFVDVHDWQVNVGLDPESEWSRHFNFTTIPQTMIIGKDGSVLRVYTGSHRDLQKEIAETIQQELGGNVDGPNGS